MLDIPPKGFATLLLIALCLLIIAFLRVYRRRQRARRTHVGIRMYRESHRTVAARTDSCWVCPQCFRTAPEPGTCANPEHDYTPVKLQPGNPLKLEEYDAMRKLVNPDDD